jgi:cell division protein FtsN
MKQQQGGTLLGFIIGVVVGLAAALAVAVYVTKVPVPFMNKVQSRTAVQDEAEAKKNKDWDPNAPLYGKNPAKPVTTPPAEVKVPAKSEPKPEAKADAKAEAKVEAKAEAKAESKPAVSADPLGDLAKAKTKATTPEADPFLYYVQVGAYRTPEDAEGQRAKLSLTGIEAKITEKEQSGRMVYRVRVGPFEKKEAAESSKAKLDSAGLATALVRVQR